MARYKVLVTREASESCEVIVEADSVQAAEELAVEAAENEMQEWTVDDNIHGPYICDPGNCAEEIPEDAPV